jgi:hypothetical protein
MFRLSDIAPGRFYKIGFTGQFFIDPFEPVTLKLLPKWYGQASDNPEEDLVGIFSCTDNEHYSPGPNPRAVSSLRVSGDGTIRVKMEVANLLQPCYFESLFELSSGYKKGLKSLKTPSDRAWTFRSTCNWSPTPIPTYILSVDTWFSDGLGTICLHTWLAIDIISDLGPVWKGYENDLQDLFKLPIQELLTDSDYRVREIAKKFIEK